MKGLGLACFESFQAGFKRGHVRFEGVDALIELGEGEPQDSPHVFELIPNLFAVIMKFLLNGCMAFGNLADIASERFGDNAQVALSSSICSGFMDRLYILFAGKMQRVVPQHSTKRLRLKCLGWHRFLGAKSMLHRIQWIRTAFTATIGYTLSAIRSDLCWCQ